jgi:hypothetical protein
VTGAPTMDEMPETVSYRYYRRVIWQAIRTKYAEALAGAAGGGVVDEAARRSAAEAVRGDVRMLMSELLTRAPVPAIVRFLAVGRDWGEVGEKIIERGDAVVELIESAYPRPTWTPLESLELQEAEDDKQWAAWTQTWMEVFGASSQAAHDALAGKPVNVSQGPGESFSTLQRWAPWLISAATILGATAVVVAATRE